MIVGSAPETAVAMMRARGVRPRSLPTCSLPMAMSAAPSTMPELLPAWWTWSICSTQWYFSSATESKPAWSPMPANDGFSLARPSTLDSGLMNSSTSSTVTPLTSLTGTIEPAKRPSAHALAARWLDSTAKVSTSSRRPALDGGDQVGADALRHERGGERGGRVGRPGAAVGAHGDAAHRLDAAGEDQVLEAAADARGGLVDGLETGGAEAVQLYAGDGVGVARRRAPRSWRCRRPGHRPARRHRARRRRPGSRRGRGCAP